MSTLIEHLQDLKAFHDKRDRPEYQALIWAMVGAHLDELIGMVEELDRLRSAPYSWAREAARPEERPTRRVHVPIKLRPMLVNGQLATDPLGPVILIDSEQSEFQQNVTLWHEALHLLGLKDEKDAEDIAERLAVAVPGVLRLLKDNINVPDSSAPSPQKE